MDLYGTAVDMVADLYVRRATGPHRSSDAAANELARIVTDKLRTTDRGASALPGLERLPMDPHARHSAAAALADIATIDPTVVSQLQPHVSAVLWDWQQQHQVADGRDRKRRGIAIAVTTVVALLLGGGVATATYLLSRPSLRDIALGTWVCDETNDERTYRYTVVIGDGTYELRLDDAESDDPPLEGTWSESNGTLSVSGIEKDKFTVSPLPALAGEGGTLNVVKVDEDGGGHTVTASPKDKGIQVDFTTDDDISIHCVKTAE